MIVLITGTPGAGKTSNTLWDFLYLPQYKDRTKYATEIRGFDYERHSVTRLETLETWQELPDGALILCDEADRYLPASGRKEMPEWIREFSRHRHRGFDFLIITQQASMIHHHVRGLIEQHIHYHRAFGLEKTSKLVWESYQVNPNSPTAKNLAQKSRIKPNPKVFSLYESTTVNTRKVQLPWKWIISAGIGITLILVAIAYMVNWSGVLKEEQAQQAETTTSASGKTTTTATATQIPGVAAFSTPGSESSQRPRTLADYIPRNPLDPSSAPIYDHLTQATDFPRVAACMIVKERTCRCYTQQATPVRGIPSGICQQMVKDGWFDPWRSGRAQSEDVLSGRPDEDSIRAQRRHAQPSSIVGSPAPVAPAYPESAPTDPNHSSGISWTQSPSYRHDLLDAYGYDPDAPG